MTKKPKSKRRRTEKSEQPRLSRANPRKSAASFRVYCHPNLIRFQEDWLDYDGSAYVLIDNDTLRSEVAEFLDNAVVVTKPKGGGDEKELPFHPKAADVREVVAALENICNVKPGTLSPPSWLDGKPDIDPKNIISCKNGLLDITTRKLHDATANFFTRTALLLDYNEKAPEPERWLQFIGEVVENDKQLMQVLQSMFGYLISNDTTQQRIFFPLGPPGSGKGTMLHVLVHLVGKRNTHSVTIEQLGGNFGLENFVGISVGIISDMTCHDKDTLSVAANRLNMISGEDHIGVPRKFKSDLEDQILPARFIIAGNNMPDFGEHALAIARRLIIMPFDKSFAAKPDRKLKQKLTAELPGILNWALEGLAALTERGDFVIPDKCMKLKTEMLYLAQPERGFVKEKCVRGPDVDIKKPTLYLAYCDYCKEMGIKPKSLEQFAIHLYRLDKRIRGERGSAECGRVQRFIGITLVDGYKPAPVPSDSHETVLREFFVVPDDETLAMLSETVEQYIARCPELRWE